MSVLPQSNNLSKLLSFLLIFVISTADASSSSNNGGSRDVLALSNWAKKSGILMHDKLQWKNYGSGDWGLVLKEPVPRGTVLLKIPRSLVLDSRVIREDISDGTCKDVLEALGNFAVHDENFWIVWRLYQLKCSGNEDFAPWLEAMPTTFPQFTKEEQDCLPFYAKYAAEYQDSKFQAFCKAAEIMISDDGSSFDTSKDDDVSTLKWAFQAVNSRFWKTVPGEHFKDITQTSELVPIGDMMNHRDPPNVQMTPADSDYVTFAYKGSDNEGSGDGDKGDKAPAEKDGDQDLFITYGQPANPHRFLVIFGFAPSPEYMPKVWSHLSYSATNPYAADIDKMVFDSRTGEVSQQVWDAILWELSEPSSQEKYLKGRDAKLVKYKSLLDDVLLNHLNKQLDELATCRGKIDKLDKTRSPNLDLIRRHNEYLTEVFAKVKNNLSATK